MAEYIDKHEAYLLLKDLEAAYIYPPAKEAYATAARRIDEIKAADVQPIQWISCKDNMPDTLERGLSTMYSDCCLVCDAFGWVGMAYYITDGQKSWWEFADAQNKNKIDWTEVTHWMPLPEPPKE